MINQLLLTKRHKKQLGKFPAIYYTILSYHLPEILNAMLAGGVYP